MKRKLAQVSLLTISFISGAFADNANSGQNDQGYVRFDYGKASIAKANDGNRYEGAKFKNNHTISVGVGFKVDEAMKNNIRTDLTITQRNFKLHNNTVETQDNESVYAVRSQGIRSTAAMLNFYYDIKLSEAFSPYLQIGAGIARNKAKTLSKIVSDAGGPYLTSTYPGKVSHDFAWQVGAGIVFKINDTVNLDLGYKHINLGKVKTKVGSEASLLGTVTTQPAAGMRLKGHEVTAGLRFDL